jgi:hypothetical protein
MLKMNFPLLRGWRAWLSFGVTFIVSGLYAIGIIDTTIYTLLVTMFGSLGLWFLSAKGMRIEKKLDEANSKVIR